MWSDVTVKYPKPRPKYKKMCSLNSPSPTHIHREGHNNDQSIDDVFQIEARHGLHYLFFLALNISWCLRNTPARLPISICVIVALRGEKRWLPLSDMNISHVWAQPRRLVLKVQLSPTWDCSAPLRPLVQWQRSALTPRLPIGPAASGLSFTEQRCQSIPRGVKRWQMPVLLGPLPVNRAWNGCLISFEWLFSPVQTICYHHVVMRAYIKQRKKGSMQTVLANITTCSFPLHMGLCNE